jgi:glycosyltransferase involved in cell wall biosynthesis
MGMKAQEIYREELEQPRRRTRKIAFIGNYLPRRCGIATFTTDLCETIASQFEGVQCFAIPVTDIESGYNYPPRVRYEIIEKDISTYHQAADFLNINGADVACLQHEFGIFGGPAGNHLLALLRDLRIPLVSTLHTVLLKPDRHQYAVLKEIIQLSDRVVVMSQRAREFLLQVYGAPEEKIEIIPHGIPNVPFIDPNFYKDQFGLQGNIVLLTFGLLSANKGIEYVIKALPEILNVQENVVYVVLGATHPNILRQEGETYRLSLQRLAKELKIENHVIFHNRFVSLQELTEFIGAADIFITPYLNEAQIVSGTLSYALGMGKAVISTPYWYAAEILADGRGILVPFADEKAIAQAVIHLLKNEAERHALRKNAYLFGRNMIWPVVANRYMEVFEKVKEERAASPRLVRPYLTMDLRPRELPPLRLDHLKRLTDHTGVLQHAVYNVPNYNEGYTTDDNARALILAILLTNLSEDKSFSPYDLASRTLAFLWHAFNPRNRRFRNLLSYDRRWLDEAGPEDAHGRALWSLGLVLGRSQVEGFRNLAGRIWELALPPVENFTSPRAWAFTLLGLREYLLRFSGDVAARRLLEILTERLINLYEQVHLPDWPWFERSLAYCNAKLPHALLAAGQILGREDVLKIALESLDWLVKIQVSPEGHFVPIGTNGFYTYGGPRARFDQQPIEAYTTLSACLEAYRFTGDKKWLLEAQRAFEWFLGENDLHVSLYDPSTGGCRDGLHPDRVNLNQGAESTLAFLLSLTEMRLIENAMIEKSQEAIK